jgi:hypothetical protein
VWPMTGAIVAGLIALGSLRAPARG